MKHRTKSLLATLSLLVVGIFGTAGVASACGAADTDGSNSISLEEFTAIAGVQLCSAPVQELIFLIADRDGSGELDCEEFFNALEDVLQTCALTRVPLPLK